MYYLRTKAATQAIQFTVDKGSGLGSGPGQELGNHSHRRGGSANQKSMNKKTSGTTKSDNNNDDPPTMPPPGGNNNNNNNMSNLPQIFGESCTSCSG